MHTPFPVDSLSESQLTKTYLDSIGRPTVVLTKTNCSDRHGGEVIVRFSVSPFPLSQR